MTDTQYRLSRNLRRPQILTNSQDFSNGGKEDKRWRSERENIDIKWRREKTIKSRK